MEGQELKIGDLVELNSGSQPMTLVCINNGMASVRYWLTTNGDLVAKEVELIALRLSQWIPPDADRQRKLEELNYRDKLADVLNNEDAYKKRHIPTIISIATTMVAIVAIYVANHKEQPAPQWRQQPKAEVRHSAPGYKPDTALRIDTLSEPLK